MRELGFGVSRDIDVFASVSRGCQGRLVWPEVFPAKSVPKAGLRESWLGRRQCWLVAGCWQESSAWLSLLRQSSRVRPRLRMSCEGSLGGGGWWETGTHPENHEATWVRPRQKDLNTRDNYGK